MREDQSPKGWTPIEDAKRGAHMLVFVLQVIAAPLESILRRRFGSRYFWWPSACALLALPMWMLLWPGEDPMPILCFWALFILCQGMARLESALMVARGDIVHTRYNGHPRLMSILRRTPEAKIKAVVEPVCVALTGIFLMPVSEPLGSYLVAGGIALALNHSLIESVELARALEMNDALIEQQQLADRFREIQNGRVRR